MHADEILLAKMIQDQKDSITPTRLAVDFAAEDGSSLNPLSSQAASLRQFEKNRQVKKNKDLKRCS